jgi:hypothetical protein
VSLTQANELGAVLKLVPKRVTISRAVVGILEEALQAAKDGEITDVAITYIRPSGNCGAQWTNDNRIALLGGLHQATHWLSNALDKDR